MAMDDDRLPLSIPYHSLTEFFNCPVCICKLKHTFITPCGHRYCEKCIKECVDRLHKCPCCNKPLKSQQLIKDHQYDELLEKILHEKEESEKQYFDSLIEEGVKTNFSKKELSPIESVLKKHLKKSLAAHEKYYQDIKEDVQKRKNTLSIEFRNRKEELLSTGLLGEEMSQRMLSLEDEMNTEKEELDNELQRTTTTVAETYDRYLLENLPSLSLLPITVSMLILAKNVIFTDVQLQPHDGILEIKKRFKECMSTRGDKVISFAEDVRFFTFGPFLKFTGHEMFHMVNDIVDHGASHPDIHLISEDCKPVLQFLMKPGSTIAIYGQIKCESDLPKTCFSNSFKKGELQSVDYFTCQDCSFNWICRSCMEVCHKNHQIVPYIMKHQPTWACCYCPKKKKCTITSSSSRPVSSLF